MFPDRFQRRCVRDDNGCLVWMGGRDSKNYGVYWHEGRNVGAHRFAFEMATGSSLERHEFVCHRCDNPPCVEPAHLFVGSHDDNMRDMVDKGRSPGGQRNWNTKLNPEAAAEIRCRYRAGGIRQIDLAVEYGVAKSAVWQIIHGHTWRVL